VLLANTRHAALSTIALCKKICHLDFIGQVTLVTHLPKRLVRSGLSKMGLPYYYDETNMLYVLCNCYASLGHTHDVCAHLPSPFLHWYDKVANMRWQKDGYQLGCIVVREHGYNHACMKTQFL
jgi:hypothetical protein